MANSEELKDVFTRDDLCKILGIRPEEDYDFDCGWMYEGLENVRAEAVERYLMDEAQDPEDPTEAELEAAKEHADDQVMLACQAEEDEHLSKIKSANLSAIETFFGHVGLDLIPKDEHDWEFGIEPAVSWEDSLKDIIQIINGIGMFYVSSVPEFLEVNCCEDAREAVLTHLHYIASYSSVYGGASPSALVDRNLR